MRWPPLEKLAGTLLSCISSASKVLTSVKIEVRLNRADQNGKQEFYSETICRLGIIWFHEALTEGNIGAPSGLIPAAANVQGKWELRVGGDFHFYESLLSFVSEVQFVDKIIYKVWDRDRTLFP